MRRKLKTKKLKKTERPSIEGKWGKLYRFWKKYGSNYLLPAIIVIFALLYFLNILEKKSLGFIIGIFYLLGLLSVIIFWIFFKKFPKWICYAMIGFSIVYFVGICYPFFNLIFPGAPLFEQIITKQNKEISIPGIKRGGYYTVYISPTSKMVGEGAYRNVRGNYNVKIGEKNLKGGFFNEWGSASAGRRGWGQEQRKHLAERHFVFINAKENKITGTQIDETLGSEVMVRIYKTALPLPLLIIFPILILSFGIFLDVKFSEQTKKLRLFPLMAISVIFTYFAIYSFEPGKELQTSLWSIIVSGIVGFIGGWLISIIAKKIKVRWRF